MGERKHDPLYIVLVLFVFVVFCCTQVVNIFNITEPDGLNWFMSSPEEISDKYYIEIRPATWTFYVWGVIYVWQLAWIVFAHFIIGIKSANDNPLYVDPPIISPILLAVYALNLALSIGWQFLFDRDEMVWALVVIFMLPVTLYFCIGQNCWVISKHRNQLARNGRKYLLYNYLFLQNGLGIYAGWTTVASMINLPIVLVYFRELSQETTSLICVCIIGAIEIGYFALEVTILERHLRYLFTPWLVVMFALIGILVENWDLEDIAIDITLALVCLAYVFLMCKIGLTMKRTWDDRKKIVELEEAEEESSGGSVILKRVSMSSHGSALEAVVDDAFDNIALEDNALA